MPKAMEETITASAARAYWRALMENVVSLIEDAALLLDQSPARARSLLILAQEETGKAHRLYAVSESAWTENLPTVALPASFIKLERWHPDKIRAALGFGAALASFWGDYAELETLREMTGEEFVEHLRVERAAREESVVAINDQKQAGLYVDRDGERIRSPQRVDTGDLAAIVTRTAGVAEMLLIENHSRMKMQAPERYDSTADLQSRLLPYSHPDDYFQTVDAVRQRDADGTRRP